MKVPDGFLLGVGDSDLQVIGESTCIREGQALQTIWRDFCKSGKVHNQDSTDIAIDRFNRMSEDVDILTALSTKHYRTSVSMSRILKEDLSPNQKGIDWYKRYFDAILQKGIALHITLYHWELPSILQEVGGWQSPRTIEALTRHAALVDEHLGQYISQYFIINEPWVVGFVGNLLGLHAPGHTDMGIALASIHNLLLAQARVARLLKGRGCKAKVGTVYNIIPAYSIDSKPENLEAQRKADEYFNRWFLDPLYFGAYPENALRRWHKYFSEPSSQELDELKVGGILDTFGINYYGGSLVKSKDDELLGFESTGRQYGVKNDMGWAIFAPPAYPRGLYDTLLALSNRYAPFGMRNIVITENGTAVKLGKLPNGEIDTNDEYRIYFIEQHLTQVFQAIQAGVPVTGYFLWTLMDNFEWAEGYRPECCFGLVHVDRETQNRTKLRSFDWYRAVLTDREFEVTRGFS